MGIKITNNAVQKILADAENLLESKDYFLLLKKLILKSKVKLGVQNLEQVEELRNLMEQITLELIEQDEVSLEKQARFEYTYIAKAKAFYASIEVWGEEERYEYLGLVFLPGVVYKLVNKQTNDNLVLVGLGLFREKEKAFMKIYHLYPKREIVAYLIYDENLFVEDELGNKEAFPRFPLKQLMSKSFLHRQWQKNCLGMIEDLEISEDLLEEIEREKVQRTLPPNIIQKIQKIRQVEEIKTIDRSVFGFSKDRLQLPENITQNQEQSSIDNRKGNRNQNYPKVPFITDNERLNAHKLTDPKKVGSSLNKNSVKIEVSQQNLLKVRETLKNWVSLSNLVAGSTRLEIVKEEDTLTLKNTKNGVLLIRFDRFGVVTVDSMIILASTLKQVASEVLQSSSVNQKYKSIATNIYAKVNSISANDTRKLLASLIEL